MTPEQLAQATGATYAVARQWVLPISSAMQHWGITTPKRQAAFLAQIGVESGGLTHLVESIDYSAEALVKMWPLRFSAQLAQQLGRTAEHPANQQRIANIAYANRFGNGDEASGDGWMYRGRGLVQLTFRANYRACGAAIGQDLLAHPELLLKPVHAANAAGWFWQTHGCNAPADTDDFARVTVRINGGMTDYEQRVQLWKQAQEAFA